MNKIKLLLGILALLFFGIGLVVINQPGSQSHTSTLQGTLSAGRMAPEITAENPAGHLIHLSDLRGYYVLLDFWASWCGPCRQNNPDLVQLYREFHQQSFEQAKGFELFSFSLDTHKEKWLNAIAGDSLEWTFHASDLQGWHSKIAADYSIDAIPQSFFIDPQGKIIAIDWPVNAIREALLPLVR